MPAAVRLRYAPSPTGEPHVGNVRTAIFNWLFARHQGGTFIIRVEDTDQARKVEGSIEDLLDSLHWLGLEWDEGPDVGGNYGPYYQSQRLDLYHQTVRQLLEGERAYYCYCSTERLSEMRKEQSRLKQGSGYDRRCRDLSEGERSKLEESSSSSVVRFKMPSDGVTAVDDLVRGRVVFENSLAEDFVMMKSDGFPTYHLAHVVDDHYMEISHVMRAEEWLPSTPRHMQLYEALGWEPPQFAHLPIILAPDRSKLSKRHGATSVLEYRRMGYLPEAMMNFLALLGWSLDDKTEILSADDLARHFTIERVRKSAAVFNADKLNWMDGHYLRQLSPRQLADALLSYWRIYPPSEFPELPDMDYLLRIVPLIHERVKTLSDAAPLIPFFFTDEVLYEPTELVQKGMDPAGTRIALEAARTELAELSSFETGHMDDVLRTLAQKLNVKTAQLFGSLRVATTGLRVSPPLFETMEVLGRGRSLDAIQKAIDKL